jgi:hypothetical protein
MMWGSSVSAVVVTEKLLWLLDDVWFPLSLSAMVVTERLLWLLDDVGFLPLYQQWL